VVGYAEIEAQLRLGSTAGEANEIYWTPVVEGDTQVVEIELAPGQSSAGLDISVPSISHLVASASDEFVVAKASAPPATSTRAATRPRGGTESAAVARIVFTDGGSSFLCSGTLLADRDTTTTIPWFLTANHCVSTQSSASTVQTYWFYRSTTCDSGVRGVLLDAHRRRHADVRDFEHGHVVHAPECHAARRRGLCRLDGRGLFHGVAVTGIHHPRGDLQKISFGTLRGYNICTPSGEGFSCRGSSSSSATFYSVAWRSGITEGGSSGSGLFLDSGKYLVGQLYGGSGGCSEASSDFYGRFDVAYNAALSQWLGTSASSTPATPDYDYSDLWWNAAESGWGLAITQHGNNTIFAAWFVYDDAGRPMWVVMPGGSWSTHDTYAGDLYATQGMDPTGAFDPSRVVTTRVGSATLRFSARDRGTLSYTAFGTSGTKAITRQVFGAPDTTPVANYGDLWWVPSESGWGLSITQQYRALFAVWYSYRSDGTPVWYVMSGGSWTSSDTYSGTLYRTANAPRPFFGSGFDPSSVSLTEVGRLTLRFSGASAATMSYTVNGVSGTKQISRQPF
jgi:V8-like Glu-specific endopeptidase